MCEFSGHSFGFWTSASCDHGHEHRGQPVSEHTLNEESTSGMMAEIFWQRAGKNCFTLHANYMLLYSICFPSAAHLLRNCTLHFLAFCLSVASCSKSAIIVADSAACASWSAALTFSVCCECRCLYRMVLKPIEAIVQSCLVEYLDFRWVFYKFRHRGITVQCLKCTMSIS